MDQYKIYKLMEDRRREYLKYRGATLDEEGNLSWAKDELVTWDEAFCEAMDIVKRFM